MEVDPRTRAAPRQPLTIHELSQTGEWFIPPWLRSIPSSALGPALKWAYAALFNMAGCREGYVEVAAVQLGGLFGASDRAARLWLDNPKGADLVKARLVERCLGADGKPLVTARGDWRLYVHGEQRALRLHSGREPPQPLFNRAEVSEQNPPEGSAEVSEQKPPLAVWTPPTQTANSSSFGEQTDRQTTEGSAEVSDQKPPFALKDQRPKKETLSLPKPQEALKDVGSLNESTFDASAERAADDGLAEVLRVSRAVPKSRETERQIAGPLAELLGRLESDYLNPEMRLQTIAGYVLREVNDREMARWVADRTAERVVRDGLPESAVDKVLASLRELRRNGTLENPGGYFQTRIRTACAQHGIPW